MSGTASRRLSSLLGMFLWRALASRVLAGLLALSAPALLVPAAAQPREAVRAAIVAAQDGTAIHTLSAGEGPAMLLVPGWMMPAQIWDAQIRHFSRNWRVVAMDPRGQGESAKTADGLHPSIRARDIAAVIRALDLVPVVLVGWSMAVTEIAAYVEQFGTAELAAVVFVDGIAGGPFDARTTPAMMRWAAGFLTEREVQTRAFVRSMFRTPQSEESLARLEAAALRMPTASAVAVLLGAMATDNRPALARIDRPVLIVHTPGAFDLAYDDMRVRIPHARIERFEGVGHALFADEPDRFNAVVDAFLRDQGLPRRR